MKLNSKTKFNWPTFILIAILIRFYFIDISWASYFAVILSLQQFILLFNSIGYNIPIRYLLGCFMCLQFFLGPTFAYNGLDQYQFARYQMKIPETDYFAYAIPAVISFLIGLHLYAGNLNGEVVNEEGIVMFVEKIQNYPIFLLLPGFFPVFSLHM